MMESFKAELTRLNGVFVELEWKHREKIMLDVIREQNTRENDLLAEIEEDEKKYLKSITQSPR